MQRTIRSIAFVLIVVFSVLVMATGCVVREISGETKPTVTKPPETKPTEKKQEETKKTTDEPKVEPPVKLKMFFGDAGIKFPDDVDLSDNPFLNIVEKAANVDLEMVQPTYADFQTKFNLTMASGDIPDIVHCWFHADINKYGADGAFANWEPLVKNSKILSKYYTQDMLDMMKTDDGSIYGLYVLNAKTSGATYARIDIIKDILFGDPYADNDDWYKQLVTPDDWYQLMKKQKEKYPDSVPFSCTGCFMMADMFFKAFGVGHDGNGIKLQVIPNEKYIWGFEAPNAREAVAFHRKLYEEELLDKTFVTNTGTEFDNRKYEKDALVFRGDPAAVIGMQTEFAKRGNTKAVVGPVHNPIAPGVSPKSAYWVNSPLGWHIVSINKKSPNIDAAVRVFEVLIDPEFCHQMAWGREGIEYFVRQDGSKVLDIEASNETSYRVAYTFMRAYWFQDNLDVRAAQMLPKLDASQASTFKKSWEIGIPIWQKESAQVPEVTAESFVPSIPDLAPKMKEARELSKAIIFKAVMGEISMEEYDKEVKDFLNKYNYIPEAYTKSYKEVLKERGQ
jgi:putative aldouronate transport system substrate-binding protein